MSEYLWATVWFHAKKKRPQMQSVFENCAAEKRRRSEGAAMSVFVDLRWPDRERGAVVWMKVSAVTENGVLWVMNESSFWRQMQQGGRWRRSVERRNRGDVGKRMLRLRLPGKRGRPRRRRSRTAKGKGRGLMLKNWGELWHLNVERWF